MPTASPTQPSPAPLTSASLAAATPRTSTHLLPHLVDSAPAVLARMNRLAEELRQRQHGTPPHPAHLSVGETLPELANNVIVLARRYADLLDQQYPLPTVSTSKGR